VGFDNVAALGRESGIKNARGTPSVAIGSYDATPLDMAGAYTVFANNGRAPGPMDAGQRSHSFGRHHQRLHANIEAGA
jgi:membrane carboxypeptidase/penicillin-binding protein